MQKYNYQRIKDWLIVFAITTTIVSLIFAGNVVVGAIAGLFLANILTNEKYYD